MHSKKRSKKVNQRLTVFFLVLVVGAVSFIFIRNGADSKIVEPDKVGGVTQSPTAAVTGSTSSPATIIPTEAGVTLAPTDEELTYPAGDPDNYVYPFNTMSADWGSEVYDEGFRFYEIPEEFVREGGCFPEVVQVYLWSLCKERGIDYYIMVALIERESDYKWDASGDGGNSIGYMQIAKKWHTERMLEEGVEDLFNPYGNIRVGLNFFQYLNDRYLASSGSHCVLMAYNMGAAGARACWDKGIYSSEYSREILSRAKEIKQELEQENG